MSEKAESKGNFEVISFLDTEGQRNINKILNEENMPAII